MHMGFPFVVMEIVTGLEMRAVQLCGQQVARINSLNSEKSRNVRAGAAERRAFSSLTGNQKIQKEIWVF